MVDKPTKPSETLPNSFGGTKENFSADKISTGYKKNTRDILGGANLNYWLDAQGKKFLYNDAISDYIVSMPIGSTIITDSNNKLTYTDTMAKATADGNGNNIANTYEPKVNVTSKGDLTTPVYFDGNGVAQTITSYGGTSERANKDGNGNNIINTYLSKSDAEDYIRQSNGMITGSVSTNSAVYADILSRLHTSFDLSKFTVVGSPVITDDGILKNCIYNVNYVKTNGYNYAGTESWEVIAPYNPNNYSSHTASEAIIHIATSPVTNALHLLCTTDNKIQFTVFGDNNSLIFNNYSTITWSSNTNYLFKIGYNGQKYYLMYSINNGYSWTSLYQKTSSSLIASGTLYTFIGVYGNASLDIGIKVGSIDLKQFSIKADGVTVFNGNKTGIDTIKTDNYTNNNLIISDCGIITGYSGTPSSVTPASISTPIIPFSNYNNWEMVFPVRFLDTNSYYVPIYSETADLRFLRSPSNSIAFLQGDGNQWFNTNFLSVRSPFSTNTLYWVKMGFTSSQYYLKYSLGKNDTYQTICQYDSSSKLRDCSFFFSYFANTSTNSLCNWDYLNNFKMYGNGKLVYQPCLKIPYTLTKGGAKIADMQYLDRVQDVYNQGYTDYQYFTIDEENEQFTLPQGMSVYEGIANNTALIKANTADIALKADKTSITTMVMPDTNNGISVTSTGSSFTYTTPANGYIAVNLQNNGGSLKINDILMMYCNTNNGFYDSNSAIYPVSKDDVISLTAGILTFYPCKEI